MAESPFASRWVRFSALSTVFAAAVFQISTWDVWWHLAYGRWIVDARAIPRTDSFSFTAFGSQRVNPEWLFQLFAYGVWELGGAPLLILVKAALVATIAAIVYRFVEREAALGPVATAAFMLPFLLAGRNRYIFRPELVTILFLAILIAALFRSRERDPRLRELLWVPALFALWANCHAGVLVGLLVLGTYLAGCALGPSSGRASRTRASTALLVLATLATLLNPWGYRVLIVPFELTAWHVEGLFRNNEWHTTPFDGQYALVWVTFALAAVVALGRPRRSRLAQLLALILILALGMRFVRNIALSCLLAPLLAVAAGTAQGDAGPILGRLRNALSRVRPVYLLPLLLTSTIVYAVVDDPFPAGLGINAERIPVHAVDYLERNALPANMLNAHAFGGYLIWRLGPEQRVFIDGRDDIYAPLRPSLQGAATDSRRWTELLEHYDIRHTILQYTNRLETVREVDEEGRVVATHHIPFAEAHFPRDRWALVYWDDRSMVHLRRTPETAALIAVDEYRQVYPENVEFQLTAIREGVADPAQAVRELLRKLDEDPQSRRAARLLTAIQQSLKASGHG